MNRGDADLVLRFCNNGTTQLEPKVLEEISLNSKIATFVKQFFSFEKGKLSSSAEGGQPAKRRTWSQIKQINYKINKTALKNLKPEALKTLLKSKKLNQLDSKDLAILLRSALIRDLDPADQAPLFTAAFERIASELLDSKDPRAKFTIELDIDALLFSQEVEKDSTRGEEKFDLDKDRQILFFNERQASTNGMCFEPVMNDLKGCIEKNLSKDRLFFLMSQRYSMTPFKALFEYILNHHSLKLAGSETGYCRLVEAQQFVETQLYHPLTAFDKRFEAIPKGGLSIKMSVPTDPWKLSTIHIEKLNQEDFQVAIDTNPLDFTPSSPIVLTAEKYV
jgi:hypothetical protein